MKLGIEGTDIEIETADLLGSGANSTLCLCTLFLCVPAERVHGLALYFLQGGSLFRSADLARYLGISPHTANQKLLRAKRAMQALLKAAQRRKETPRLAARADLVALRTRTETEAGEEGAGNAL